MKTDISTLKIYKPQENITIKRTGNTKVNIAPQVGEICFFLIEYGSWKHT